MCDQAVIDLECQCLQREPYSNTASYIFILIFCKGSCSELCRTLKPVCTVKKGCHWAETDSEKAAFKLKIYFTAHSIHLMELQICLKCAVNPHKFSTSANLWLVNFRRWSTTSHSESSYLWRVERQKAPNGNAFIAHLLWCDVQSVKLFVTWLSVQTVRVVEIIQLLIFN